MSRGPHKHKRIRVDPTRARGAWEHDERPRCPACGFTYSVYFPKLAAAVEVTSEIQLRLRGTREHCRHSHPVGSMIYLCAGCWEHLVQGRVSIEAPMIERWGPQYGKDQTDMRKSARREYAADAPFTDSGKKNVVGNGVPLPMGRAIAKAVRQALERMEPEQRKQ